MAAEKRNKDLLVGAVIGGVLGAVTALLFAPKSGCELRADLKEGYHQVSEKTQQIAGDVAEKSKQVAVQVSQEVKSWRSGKSENGTAEVAAAEASIAATTVEREEH
ncbi:YtxH-like protein [Paenibacillus tianmuensis]|uniref:YtxH-like protein n=1 Tax=Paenibacillus tianmuensis TaxID=624147 RepID=A0A1G4TV07_9BACL|nr:YtxH domain-containing protein [Paenibacillus tianmuensis]SCW85201.1 YtxH-like protein [Paenibacillus tianmuensis]